MPSYVYPGQSFDHTLLPLKGWYREAALDAEVAFSTNVNLGSVATPPTSGLCVHATDANAQSDVYGGSVNGPGTMVVEMGCGAGHGMPLFLWTNSTDPDVYNPGVIAGVTPAGTTSYPPDFLSVFPPVAGGTMPINLVALVATGGYELETTEYDTAQTYAAGNGLRAVTSNTNANAGRLTNQGASSAAFTNSTTLAYGDPALSAWDTIVGFVSRETYTNANRRPSLAFWPVIIPGTR